jgi:hypothetical protein
VPEVPANYTVEIPSLYVTLEIHPNALKRFTAEDVALAFRDGFDHRRQHPVFPDRWIMVGWNHMQLLELVATEPQPRHWLVFHANTFQRSLERQVRAHHRRNL